MDPNMITRGITGALFVFTVIVVILSSFWSMIAFFLVITILGLIEFYNLRKNQFQGLQIWPILLCGISTFIMLVFHDAVAEFKNQAIRYEYIILPFLILICVLTDLFSKKQQTFANTSNAIFATLYIALPFGLLTHLAQFNEQEFIYDGKIILYLFILIWANDTFAYLVGKFLGKRKLWERISPKKTWEGFIGGCVFTCITFYFILEAAESAVQPQLFLIPIAVSIFATLGDLSESLLKRQAGVKDSGTILPGHGGILDRFDGLLLTVPVLFFILELSKLF